VRARHCVWIAVAIGAASCGPSGAHTGTAPAASPLSVPSQDRDAGDATLGHDLDAYVLAFGRNWGEGSAFSGYVALARDGNVIFGKAYGKADRERGVAADRDTLFRIGSLSKPFTAVSIMQLAERGLLRVEDPVRNYLPEIPPMADSVTIHNCLTHTSGLPPLPDDPALVAETGALHPVGAAFASYQGKTLRFPPGDRFEYSNAGYTVLAAIIERVTGQSYEAYLRQSVFGPAGMVRTTTVSTSNTPNAAVGYAIDERDDIVPAAPISYVTVGSGSILSTVDDLIAWDRALGGTKLLSDASKRRMFTPDKDAGAIVSPPARYGYGWFVSQDAGHDVFFHGGGVDGFEASFARVPDAKVTVVVLSNVFGSEAVTKVAQAARAVALTGKTPAPPEERAATTFEPTQLAGLAGDYGIDKPSVAAMREKLPREADSLRGLSMTTAEGRLFMNFAGPRHEVFRAGDGALFTKQTGLVLGPEGAAVGRVPAVVVTWLDHGPLRARYERLGTQLDVAASLGSCPAGMVRLPGGQLATERGGASVEPFCIDLSEVTVMAYEACMRSGKCVEEPTTAEWAGISQAERSKWSVPCNGRHRDRQDHPINCVSWAQSVAYCRAQGKRLPTAAEWQWAARGGEQARTYPWGYRAPDSQVCWSGLQKRSGTCAVGAFPGGDALGGIHDLAGNVWEWTSDTSGVTDHVAKGTGWNETDPTNLRSDAHPPGEAGEAGYRGPITGFRCAK